MTLHLPTRELVGLLADVYPFASPDDEDPAWHRVVLRWDGTRLHAMAGNGYRLAWMSWGPDDGDAPTIPGLDFSGGADADWELAILPENAKEIAKKFKLGVKLGDALVRVDGSTDSLRVERDADIAGVALRSSALSRPWDEKHPVIDSMISDIAAAAKKADARKSVLYSGPALADFCNPKVVRQRGNGVELMFGKSSTYIQIGDHFRGAVVQARQDD